MSDYEVAIPSYDRAQTLKEKTLSLLSYYKIPASKITIFVANQEQKDLYDLVLHPDSYNKIILACPGIRDVRNFISDYYPLGARVVCFDDDITDFITYSPEFPRSEASLVNLSAFIDTAFKVCEREECHLWGVYPVANGFFMSGTLTKSLKFIIGIFFGYINQKIKLNVDIKSDYEQSILYYKLDKKVIRFNFVAPVSRCYKQKGGLFDYRTVENVQSSVDFLKASYPEYVSENLIRKSGFPEIRLRVKNLTRA